MLQTGVFFLSNTSRVVCYRMIDWKKPWINEWKGLEKPWICLRLLSQEPCICQCIVLPSPSCFGLSKYSISILTAIFQVNLVSQCLLKQRTMEVAVTTGLLELYIIIVIVIIIFLSPSHAQLQSNHHHQHPVFTGRMPFLLPNQQCQSNEWKNITFHGLAYPKLTWGYSNFVCLATNSCWLPQGWGLPWLSLHYALAS